ncbi:MAG: adenylate kinase [Oscillospiraceae bacterium]
MRLILLGAPGAGKGTQAEVISERMSIPIISTGNILKEAVRKETPLGVSAKDFMDKGELVPDEVIIGIVRDRLFEDDCKAGFILDGVPRTIAQANALTSLGIEIDKVLDIDVSDEEIVKRLSGRRICSSCGASFHTRFKPPIKEGICDKCGQPLIIRSDDEETTVINRLKVYHENTEPLKDYYSKLGKLRVVDGHKDIAETTRLTLAALEV